VKPHSNIRDRCALCVRDRGRFVRYHTVQVALLHRWVFHCTVPRCSVYNVPNQYVLLHPQRATWALVCTAVHSALTVALPGCIKLRRVY
jgi:hypothetical protein